MRLTIGRKLNGLIAGLQLLSIVGVVALATQLFTNDLTGLLRKGTLDASVMLAGRVRAEMKHVADRARILGAASLESYRYPEDQIRFLQENLAADPQLLVLGLFRKEQEGYRSLWRILQPELQRAGQIKAEDFAEMDRKYPLHFDTLVQGGVQVSLAAMKDGTPTFRLALPFVKQSDGNFSQFLVLDLHQQRLTALFSEATAYTSYLVDGNGIVLASTDPNKIRPGSDLSGLSIFGSVRKQQGQGGQEDFEDPQGAAQLGAYQRVGFANLTVFSQIPMAQADQAQSKLYRRTAFLAAAFLSFALFLGLLFSKSLTGPIRALAAAAERVAQGDFTVRLGSGDSGRARDSADEIRQFSSTFDHMVEGLQERDRVKATFSKFHSREVAEKLMSGEVKLGGERKNAVVFFSDVRGFTAMSERLNPEALVTILNRYMSRMVSVILENGGIVDKYVGDAIMALWGVPIGRDGDCARAVEACLGMRKALAELNGEFKAEGLPELRIGMGLNYGPLVAGNIGSEQRMEYTVIGDTVNTASRIESLTKEFGTDLLISKEVLDQLGGRFVVEKAHEAKVKGKSEPLSVFRVQGFIDSEGREVLVQTAYSSYEAEKSDKVVHENAV